MKAPPSAYHALKSLIRAHLSKSKAGLIRRNENHIEEIYNFCFQYLLQDGFLDSDFKPDFTGSTPEIIIFNVQRDHKGNRWSDHYLAIHEDSLKDNGFNVSAHSLSSESVEGGKPAYHKALVTAFIAKLLAPVDPSWIEPSIELPDWHPLHGVW